jgi:class 3 adenylate cyclase
MDARSITLVATLALLGVLVYLWWRAHTAGSQLRRRLETAAMELQRLQISFARFAPEEVVERIVATGVPTAAEKKEVTILFADLVSFTRLGEQLAPDALVKLLNEYFARMSRVITEHRGHVSKFIGDGLLALFGALEANPWQANDAVRAALAMRVELERYNQKLAAEGLPRLAFGIGVHRGVAIAGIVGSHELMEFTVIGNAVNIASRVEHLTRQHGVDILITDAVRQALDPRFALRELPAVTIRGISETMVTFAVNGFDA